MEIFRVEVGRSGEMFVTGRFAVENAAVLVHNGVNRWMRGSTVFRLHVKNAIADFHIRVEARAHRVWGRGLLR
jgi:hypothetical protein